MAKSILVIEDDPGYQDLFQALLHEYGIVVRASVEEVMNFDFRKFDLIISDINLLGQSGLQLLTRLKELKLEEKVPLLLCSSQDDPATKRRGNELGAAGFLAKPFNNEQLLTIVRSLLK